MDQGPSLQEEVRPKEVKRSPTATGGGREEPGGALRGARARRALLVAVLGARRAG